MSHHSMAYRAGGTFVSSAARLLANAVRMNRCDRRFFIVVSAECQIDEENVHGYLEFPVRVDPF